MLILLARIKKMRHACNIAIRNVEHGRLCLLPERLCPGHEDVSAIWMPELLRRNIHFLFE
ncbi:MAG: hypothetical protein WCV99_08730 [Sterolibacterium sp.]|jgi:hypothetical protein